MKAKEDKKLNIPTLKRLPLYYNIAVRALARGENYISSAFIAEKLDIDATQVRKDIAAIGYVGKPKVGFDAKEFSAHLEIFLGFSKERNVILIGAGNLGIALAKYDGFTQYGLSIKAIFDKDPEKIGTKIADKDVIDMNKLSEYIKEHDIKIAIITIPAQYAQKVADQLISNGVKAIWNFAPVNLNLPKEVICWNQDLAASFITFVQLLD